MMSTTSTFLYVPVSPGRKDMTGKISQLTAPTNSFTVTKLIFAATNRLGLIVLAQ